MATTNEGTHSIRRTARAAGILYLVIFIVAPLAYLVARSSILVETDAAATAQNLIDNESRFRLGLAAESVVFLVEIVLAALLYVILRPVSKTISLAAAFSRVAEAVVQAANLLPPAWRSSRSAVPATSRHSTRSSETISSCSPSTRTTS
jgi:hypothetical protein